MSESPQFLPLYPRHGGPPRGFACEKCRAVCRSYRGILLHLQLKHLTVFQAEMPFDDPAEVETAAK
jgi:hypothetical protein